MNHADHVALIREAVRGPGGVWADFGSGRGAFTLALAELIGPEGEIYSLDKDSAGLREQKRELDARFPEVRVHYLHADFTRALHLPPLDGIVMANSLHFHPEKDPLVSRIAGYLRPGGRLVLVEYNTSRGNPWVPYPIPVLEWEQLAERVGFVQTTMLARRPSRFNHEIYSALSLKAG